MIDDKKVDEDCIKLLSFVSKEVLDLYHSMFEIKTLKDAYWTFEGWNGESKYKLDNGQVWQQTEYKYEYKYAYRPEVVICDVDGKYLMYVEDTQAVVNKI